MSDNGERKLKLSRRDFFNLVRVGGAAVTAFVAGVEIGNDPHFINGLKVTKELTEAQLSKDPNRIYESRKLAMVWLFAETAIKFSDRMGLGKAGMTMEHYLYGNGKPLDISFVFEKITDMSPERFVGNLIFYEVRNRQNNTVNKVTDEIHYTFIKRALRDLKSEEGLQTELSAESIPTWRELRYAFGGAKYELHASEAYIESANRSAQRVVLEKGVELTITDRYNWEKDWQIYIPGKASEVAEHILGPILDKFYKSKDLVEHTIRGLGLGDTDSDIIMEIYSNTSRFKTMSNVKSNVYDFAVETNISLINQPDLVEKDFNLLKKIGAADYDMKGHIHLTNRLEFPV